MIKSFNPYLTALNLVSSMKKRSWKRMNNEEIIEYGKARGYQNLKLLDVKKSDGGYIRMLQIRNLTRNVFQIEKKDWKSMADEELVEYGIKHGYKGMSHIELEKIDNKYYNTLVRRKLTNSIIRFSRKSPRNWDKMTDGEIIEYGKNSGYEGFTPSKLSSKDQSYLNVLRERGLVYDILKTANKWQHMSNEEILDYAKSLNFDKLSRSEMQNKNKNLYSVLDRRGILTNFAESKIKPKGYWENWNNFKKEVEPKLNDFYRKNGRLPTSVEWEKLSARVASIVYKYHEGWKEVYSKMGYLVPSSEKNLINYLENSEIPRRVAEKFGGDTAVVADILSVMNEGASRNQIMKILETPSLREWLGKYKKEINSLNDLMWLEKKLLPLDKNGIIEDILKNSALEYMRRNLGPNPSESKKIEFMEELEGSLYAK